ncbi:Hypothetical predicted protein [Podarcis lilfordi]|uniref:Uncharacterized protein n=1 Tax=Podarcis lilfordi TaxID=74358 RepID=A0AA35JPH1_9SAUR|nr:Hypothetical predicted protein [Podarcis lilfordi]
MNWAMLTVQFAFSEHTISPSSVLSNLGLSSHASSKCENFPSQGFFPSTASSKQICCEATVKLEAFTGLINCLWPRYRSTDFVKRLFETKAGGLGFILQQLLLGFCFVHLIYKIEIHSIKFCMELFFW